MRCPACGLENPPTALYCDCGHSFAPAPGSLHGISLTDEYTPPEQRSRVQTFTYRKVGNTYLLESSWGKSMDKHIQEMLEQGWRLLNSANIPSHLNLGRTVVGMALTGGLSLLLGASRSSERITLTFQK